MREPAGVVAGASPPGMLLVAVAPPFHIPSFAFELAWHARRGGDSGLQWLIGQVQGMLSEGRR